MNSFPNIGQITLYSGDQKKLASFFSHLLDIEIIEIDQQLILRNEAFSLCIVDNSSHKRKSNGNDMLCSLIFANSSEVEDLLSKLQFMSYRSSDQYLSDGTQVIRSDNGQSFFDACDPDGRKWRFLAYS